MDIQKSKLTIEGHHLTSYRHNETLYLSQARSGQILLETFCGKSLETTTTSPRRW